MFSGLVKGFRLFVFFTNEKLFWTAWLLTCLRFNWINSIIVLLTRIYICLTVSKLSHSKCQNEGTDNLKALTALLKMNTTQRAREILGKGRDGTEPQLSNVLLIVSRFTSLVMVSLADSVWPGLACTCFDLRWLALTLVEIKFTREFVTIWPSNPSHTRDIVCLWVVIF